MKRLLLSFAFLALSRGTFAQAPQGINYQAVIRDGVGVTLNNTNVGMKISIIQTSPGGTVVYEESFATTTSQYGLVNVVVGQGTVISGNFSLIDWAVGPYFVEVAADENGGTSYTTMGTQQLMSVPYALYAENSGTAGPAGPQGPAGNDGIDGIDGAAGATGATGPQGIPGNVGAVGATGPAGPQGPAGTNGTSGTNGVSVNWLGTFTTAPVSPAINDGYYNSTVGISYIWNGAWNIIAQDGASSSGSGSNPNTLIYTVDGF
ncbi:MAG: hypothetical protein P8P87_05935 [Crocinitomicaceae bacterium]|nr:hypothetical protein [Crocinitomicaceae bacterium]